MEWLRSQREENAGRSQCTTVTPPTAVTTHRSSLAQCKELTVHVDREEVAPNDTQAAASAQRRA